RLALRDAGAGRGDAEAVGREHPLGGLEGGPGAGGGLVEEVHHHLPAQRGDLLDGPLQDLLEAVGRVQERLDLRGLQLLDPQQVAVGIGAQRSLLEALGARAPAAFSRSTTRSSPSSSWSRTWTLSSRDVVRVRPT